MRVPILLLVAGCTSVSDPLGPIPSQNIVVVATAADDFSTGALEVVSIEDWTVYGPITAVSGDPIVTYLGQELAQINRLGTDTIRLYDPTLWGAPNLEFSVGSGANPHAVVQCGEEVWTTLYARDYIARYADGIEVGTIDLSSFSDADTLPEASDMVQIGDDVYVVLQRLNREEGWTPEPTGQVVRISCTDKTILQSWDVGPNSRLTKVVDEHIWVTPVTGPLTRIHTETQTNEVIDIDFGDYQAQQTAWVSSSTGMAIGFKQDAGYGLFCIDSDTKDSTLALETESYLTDIRRVGTHIWVSARRSWLDASAFGGLMIWDPQTCTEITENQWVRTGLDPVSITWIPGDN